MRNTTPLSREWAGRAEKWLAMPPTYAGITLLFISSALILMPELPPGSKDFLMVAFACVALLPGYHQD
jgi:hypothetical protein